MAPVNLRQLRDHLNASLDPFMQEVSFICTHTRVCACLLCVSAVHEAVLDASSNADAFVATLFT